MPLQKSPLNINFAKGLDQKTDPLQVQPGRFLGLTNRVFNKMGLLEKRNGYRSSGKTVVAPGPSYGFSQIPGSIAAGRNITTYQSELLENDGLGLYSYATNSDNWVYKGRAELCQASATSIYKNQFNNLGADSAFNATLGLKVFAWESWTGDPAKYGTLTGVQISVIDSVTGQTVYNIYLSSTTSRPKCVSISNKLYVVYYDSADSSLHAIPCAQSGLGSAVVVASNIDTTNTNYDVAVNGAGIYVAYNGTGTTVKVALFNSSFTLSASASKSESASNGVGVFFDASGNVWVPYNNGSATKAFIMDSSLGSTVLAPAVVDSGSAASGVHNITGTFDGTRGIIFYDKPGSLMLAQVTDFSVTSSFVQPAVGSTVNVTINAGTPSFPEANTIVYLPTGGYYFCAGQVIGVASLTLKNLGYPGNAAPGATVAATAQNLYPTAGYQNSIITFNTLTSAGVVGSAQTFLRSVCLGSKAFVVNGVAHVLAMHDSPLQPTGFLCALYNTVSPIPNAAVVAKVFESAAGGIPYRSLLPAISFLSSGIVSFAVLTRSFEVQQTAGNTAHVIYYLGVSSSTIDFVTDDIQDSELGDNLQISSGTLLMYDGASTVEQGFHLYPETVTVANDVVGGDLLGGTYGYKIVYEWIDNQGQTHRSAPSLNVSITLPATTYSGNTITIPTLRITEKQSVTMAVYRTLKDGTVYFRIDPNLVLEFPVNNNTAQDFVTLIDVLNDDKIAGNEQLYTDQEVENIAAPAPLAIADYKNRIILIPSDNPYVYWFSKQVISGSPVEFSDLFQKNVGTIGGPLVGAAKLDDKLILFKGTSIYYVTGTGPSPNGTNDDFSDPQFITADAGLLSPRSIVVTPVGLMFKSSKGIYLLDRSLQTKYIGKAVEDYNQFTVRGAQLIPKGNQIRFILSNGQCLMYDYYWADEEGIGQWAVFDNVAAVSDCIFQNLHTYVTTAGLVYQESPGTYLDGATPVNTYFKTGWFNLAGLQGFERAYYFYFLAQYLSAHSLSINIYYDYDSTTAYPVPIITPVAGDLEQWRVFLSKQKCQAFQIELQESGSSGPGFSMSGLNLIVAMKKGYNTITAAKSTG